jgi:hypothetical protein
MNDKKTNEWTQPATIQALLQCSTEQNECPIEIATILQNPEVWFWSNSPSDYVVSH